MKTTLEQCKHIRVFWMLSKINKSKYRSFHRDIHRVFPHLSFERYELEFMMVYLDGYAGLDICSTGTPLICWDFCPKPNNIQDPIIYPHYKNIKEFVSKSIEILTNENEANNLSLLQSDDILKNRNTQDKIFIIENEYQRIYKNTK